MPKDIKNNVMRRVYILHTLRQVFSPAMLKVYIAVAFVWQILLRVSVGNVFNNFLESQNQIVFWSSALSRTETSVIVLTVAFIALSAWLLADIFNRKKLTFQVERGER